jgi:hypothetical protein
MGAPDTALKTLLRLPGESADANQALSSWASISEAIGIPKAVVSTGETPVPSEIASPRRSLGSPVTGLQQGQK